MEIEFHPSAQAELDATVGFYESRLEGLGIRFLAAVEETTERIVASPDAASPLGEGFRKRLVPGFPFRIVYRRLEQRVFIVAIAHQHRRPGYWHRRLSRG